MNNCILVTGGAGFIGSNFVNAWVKLGLGKVVNLDKLTYAGNLSLPCTKSVQRTTLPCFDIRSVASASR